MIFSNYAPNFIDFVTHKSYKDSQNKHSFLYFYDI